MSTYNLFGDSEIFHTYTYTIPYLSHFIRSLSKWFHSYSIHFFFSISLKSKTKKMYENQIRILLRRKYWSRFHFFFCICEQIIESIHNSWWWFDLKVGFDSGQNGFKLNFPISTECNKSHKQFFKSSVESHQKHHHFPLT